MADVVTVVESHPHTPWGSAAEEAKSLALYVPISVAEKWRKVRVEMEPKALKKKAWVARN